MMWDELYTYKPLLTCSCDGGVNFAAEREEEKVSKFVMGLDESRFGNVVQAIIDADPGPSLEEAYSCVIREEQRLLNTQTR